MVCRNLHSIFEIHNLFLTFFTDSSYVLFICNLVVHNGLVDSKVTQSTDNQQLMPSQAMFLF